MKNLTTALNAMSAGHYRKVSVLNDYGLGIVVGFGYDKIFNKTNVLVDMHPHMPENQIVLSLEDIDIQTYCPTPEELFLYVHNKDIHIHTWNLNGSKIAMGVFLIDGRTWSDSMHATDDPDADKHQLGVSLIKKELAYAWRTPPNMDFVLDKQLLNGDVIESLENLVTNHLNGKKYTFVVNGSKIVGSIANIKMRDNDVMVQLDTYDSIDGELLSAKLSVKLSSISEITENIPFNVQFHDDIVGKIQWNFIHYDSSSKKSAILVYWDGTKMHTIQSDEILESSGSFYASHIDQYPEVRKELLSKLYKMLA